MKQLFLLCFCVTSLLSFSQVNPAHEVNEKPLLSIRGSVYIQGSREPIANVKVYINGGAYTQTNKAGDFRIRARIDDKLVVEHWDFETVYHTITSDERIDIQVDVGERSSVKSRYANKNTFNRAIDSALYYKKTDAEKSLQYVTQALQISNSKSQNAEAYETLADIYSYLKQYDLAVANYEISLQNNITPEVDIKLAQTLFANKDYDKSLAVFSRLKQLSNYQKVEQYEGMGDVYKAKQEFNKAVDYYNKALKIAEKHLIKPKVTNLNSKIADAYADTGNLSEAEDFYGNSMELANQEGLTRALQEKVKVADFQNKNQLYDKEIQLRKEALQDIEQSTESEDFDNESALTPQKQNYKIGNAYYLQKDYSKAIPYLEKSIAEAETNSDLTVKKDATRKLSEVFRDAGDYTKALNAYEAYTESVEALNVKKEQELIRASRVKKEIVAKQARIASLEADKKLSASQYQLTNERNKRQQLIIYSLIGGLMLLLLAAYLMYKNIKQQRLANNLLALKSLRSQMNPHFIFNALNSVNSFIATSDERTANRYLSDFSKLMRAVLENSEDDFIPLQKEIELLQLYTKLEHFRFKDKFDYNITIDEAIDVEGFQIPPMLLQPYIENAVWHGLRYKTTKGQLDIVMTKTKPDEISITITDNGIGRERSKALKTQHQKRQNSKGMSNIKKRVSILNTMYKDKVDVHITDQDTAAEDQGTQVTVTLKKD